MALNATIYRFTIDLADMDRSIYQNLSVHVALHPSETIERMVMRLLAYCLNYHERLQFTKGLSTDSEPDLWRHAYNGEIEHWIELGLPDAKRVKRACSRSEQVTIYAYGGQALDSWWQTMKNTFARQDDLEAFQFDEAVIAEFSEQVTRTMSLSCMIQEGIVTLSWDAQMLECSVSHLE